MAAGSIERLINPDAGAPFEVKMLRICALIAAVAMLAFVIPSNFLLDLPVEVALTSGGLGAASLAIYAASRRGRHLYRSFCAATVAALNVIWFFNYGMDGSVIYWFFVVGGIMTVLLRGRGREVAMVMLVLDGAALLIVDHLYPGLSNRFATTDERTLDLVTGFIIALATGLAACRATVDVHYRDRDRLARLNAELEQTLAEVNTLRGLLPICGWCKKIRADDGAWTAIDRYLSSHTDVVFTHGICPTCMERHFPEDESQTRL